MGKKNSNMTSFFVGILLCGNIGFAVCSEDNISYIEQEQSKYFDHASDLHKKMADANIDQHSDNVKQFSLELSPLKDAIETVKNYGVSMCQLGYDNTKEVVDNVNTYINNKQIQYKQESNAILRKKGDAVQQPPYEMTALKNGVVRSGYSLAKTFKDDVIPLCEQNYDKAKKFIDQCNAQREEAQIQYRREADALIRKQAESIRQEMGSVSTDAFKTFLDKNESEKDFIERKLVAFDLSMMKVGIAGAIFVGLSCALYTLSEKLYKNYEKYYKNNNQNSIDEQVE